MKALQKNVNISLGVVLAMMAAVIAAEIWALTLYDEMSPGRSVVAIVGHVAAAGMLVLAWFVLLRQIERRLQAEQEVRLNNDRLEERIRHRTEQLADVNSQLARLSRQLMTVQENERRHLARELHDEIGQVLTAVNINLQYLKSLSSFGGVGMQRLAESIGIVSSAIQQVREMSLDLRPSILDDFGLEAALRWFLDRHKQRAGGEVHFVAHTSGERMPADIETACFRVVQEALTNIARHARAKSIDVSLTLDDDTLRLTVQDDGRGFDLAEIRALRAGASMGLVNMKERVELIGGHIDIDSSPGKGTAVRAAWPLPRSETPCDPQPGDSAA